MAEESQHYHGRAGRTGGRGERREEKVGKGIRSYEEEEKVGREEEGGEKEEERKKQGREGMKDKEEGMGTNRRRGREAREERCRCASWMILLINRKVSVVWKRRGWKGVK